MTAAKSTETLNAVASNDWARLREIAGRECILSVIRDAREYAARAAAPVQLDLFGVAA